MGKTIFIVRHGEAKSTEPGGKDIDRELAAEGLQQSSRLGVYIYKKNTDIDGIITSNALRAKQTAELIADQLNFDISKIVEDEDIYEASVRILLDKVSALNTDWNEVILVGHNPVISYFVEYLTGHHFDGMVPGSMVKVSFDSEDWNLISQESATFQYHVTPADYTIGL